VSTGVSLANHGADLFVEVGVDEAGSICAGVSSGAAAASACFLAAADLVGVPAGMTTALLGVIWMPPSAFAFFGVNLAGAGLAGSSLTAVEEP
jgi:hypothetical protein